MRAIVASPEKIAGMCRPVMRLSQESRARIVARIEREEQLRLSRNQRMAKASRVRRRAA
jgi:hypothetical protein